MAIRRGRVILAILLGALVVSLWRTVVVERDRHGVEADGDIGERPGKHGAGKRLSSQTARSRIDATRITLCSQGDSSWRLVVDGSF